MKKKRRKKRIGKIVQSWEKSGKARVIQKKNPQVDHVNWPYLTARKRDWFLLQHGGETSCYRVYDL